MTKEQESLLRLLKVYLTENDDLSEKDILWENTLKKNISSIDFSEIVRIAGKHAVLPFLYDFVMENDEIEQGIKEQTEYVAVKAALQSYRIAFLSKAIIEKLQESGVFAVLLKGVAVASFYKTPELRKTGDVDLLLLKTEQLKEAVSVLEKMGFEKKKNQTSLHHITFNSPENIEIELHLMLAEPFDNKKMNDYMEKILKECDCDNVKLQNVIGIKMPVLEDGYYAYELLLHMLQHFLRSGFGLKLLCDWVVFWNREDISDEEKENYVRMVKESGIKGFSDMITGVCTRYLGLKQKNVEFMQIVPGLDTEGFVEEIFEAEEFGKSSRNRTVTMRGNSVIDYVREFHHQMQLNFPKASRCIICWPVLWVVTLFRFIKNNRTIRKTSTMNVLKKAGKRSEIMKQIELFK